MKRSWIGFGMLLVLLVLALLVTWAMDRIHEPIARDLETAADYVMAGDWELAEVFSEQALRAWEKHAHFRACFADHTPMEDIDACFAELKIYTLRREETAFAASCGQIARKVEAIGEAHGLVWWNVL